MEGDAEAGAEAHEGRQVGAQHLRQVYVGVPGGWWPNVALLQFHKV